MVMHGISIHEPSHYLLVGVDIWGGYVPVRTEQINDFRKISARQPFQFSHR